MKKLANLLAVISISLFVYTVIVKFTGQLFIDWGFIKAKASSGLILATFLMLIAIYIKLLIKEEKGFIIGSVSKRRVLFWLSSVVITGVFLGLLSFHLIPHGKELIDQRAIKRFNQIYVESQAWRRTKWLGINCLQNPCDQWIMQEIISEIKPDFIIETGTYMGGSSLFYATVLEKVNKNGKVITIDINPQVEEAAKLKIFKERIEVIKGDSVSPDVINAIANQVKGKKVLVTLDSRHTKKHVLKELNLYSKFVSLNSYIVVQDTFFDIFTDLGPRYGLVGPGPMKAIEEFLKTDKAFEIDHSREKFLLTFYPSGYLKRVK